MAYKQLNHLSLRMVKRWQKRECRLTNKRLLWRKEPSKNIRNKDKDKDDKETGLLIKDISADSRVTSDGKLWVITIPTRSREYLFQVSSHNEAVAWAEALNGARQKVEKFHASKRDLETSLFNVLDDEEESELIEASISRASRTYGQGTRTQSAATVGVEPSPRSQDDVDITHDPQRAASARELTGSEG